VNTGVEGWSDVVEDKGAFCGSPTIGGDYVYLTSYDFSTDGYPFKYDKEDGDDPVAEVQISRTDALPAIDLDGGLIYVSGGCYGYASPSIVCYDVNDFSSDVWNRTGEDMGGWTCSVTLAGGYAFVGKETGGSFCYHTIYALNATTGATEWFYPYGGGTAAIANDKIYTVDNGGDVYVFG